MAYLEIDEILSYKKYGKFPLLYTYNEIREAYFYLIKRLDKDINVDDLNKKMDTEFMFMDRHIVETVETLENILKVIDNSKLINVYLNNKTYNRLRIRSFLSRKDIIKNCYILDVQDSLNMLNYIKHNTTSILDYVIINKGFNSNMFREYTTYLVNMVAIFLD